MVIANIFLCIYWAPCAALSLSHVTSLNLHNILVIFSEVVIKVESC